MLICVLLIMELSCCRIWNASHVCFWARIAEIKVLYNWFCKIQKICQRHVHLIYCVHQKKSVMEAWKMLAISDSDVRIKDCFKWQQGCRISWSWLVEEWWTKVWPFIIVGYFVISFIHSVTIWAIDIWCCRTLLI